MGAIRIDGFFCERCDHKWVSRVNSNNKPIVCPKCHSPYWNMLKKNKKEVKVK